MRAYNITKNIQEQTLKNEYINELEKQYNSIYQYLHYYNPQWRLLNDKGKDPVYYTKKDADGGKNTITASNVMDYTGERPKLQLEHFQFRWGIKNTDEEYWDLYYKEISLGIILPQSGTIFKKDSIDLSLMESPDEILSHFAIFFTAEAQFYGWNFYYNNEEIHYNYYSTNENEFGLKFPVQLVLVPPRYFFNKSHFVQTNWGYIYGIGHIFDNNNRVENESKNQQWNSASPVVTEVQFNNDESFEQLIGDFITNQSTNSKAAFIVRLDENRNITDLEKKFEIIIC